MNKQDDFIRIESIFFGSVNIQLSKLDLSWPPPKFLVMEEDGILREATKDDDRAHLLGRVRMSQLTDEQIETMDGVVRGAEYRYISTGEDSEH